MLKMTRQEASRKLGLEVGPFDYLISQLRAASFPLPILEHPFAPPRRWRFDMCWVKEMVALEIEGGVHINGRHNRAKGFLSDMAKYNEATIRGWKLLRVTPSMIESGDAFALLARVLG
jgi:hypothetical protein